TGVQTCALPIFLALSGGGAGNDPSAARVGHTDALGAVGQVHALTSSLVQCLQPQARAFLADDVDVIAALVRNKGRAMQFADGLDQRSHELVLLQQVRDSTEQWANRDRGRTAP